MAQEPRPVGALRPQLASEASQAHPAGFVQRPAALMQPFPHALPFRQTLQHWRAAWVVVAAGLNADGRQCERGPLAGTVSYVRDGDTIELAGRGIRLQGLAAPEGDEPGGAEATAAMVELADGRQVRCELNGERTHDRCVAVCSQ